MYMYWSCSKLKYGVFYINICAGQKLVLFIRKQLIQTPFDLNTMSSFILKSFDGIRLIMCLFFLNYYILLKRFFIALFVWTLLEDGQFAY